MLNQPKPTSAHIRMLIRGHTLHHCRAIQLHIQITRAGNLHRSHPRSLRQLRLQLLRNRPRSLLQPFRQLERNGQCHLPKLDLRWQLDREILERNLVALLQQRLDSCLQLQLQCSIHDCLSEPLSEASGIATRKPRAESLTA